jgi:hypothetical protein
MLNVNQYSSAYISECRARFNEQLSAYQRLVEDSDAPNVSSFERKFCRTLLLSLDNSFVNRVDHELPGTLVLSEVRVLCDSLLRNDGRVLNDRRMPLRHHTVLGLAAGDPIELTADRLAELSAAFFDAVSLTYGRPATQRAAG